MTTSGASPEASGFEFDLLIIGGGIVGAGVARDAAMRGLRTILVEQGDFASGTSSRSSRLLHGGLRYLAQMRIGLVREASVEKMILSRIAPHLCQPLPFVFPVRKGSGWKLWQLAIGVRVYDWLCGGRNLGKSTRLSAAATAQILPGLRSDDLQGATRHFDGLTNDARLVIDTLRSCKPNAQLRNYTKFLSARRENNRWECEIRGHAGDVENVSAKFIVNAAGAWASSFPQSSVKLRLTKGVHLVIPRGKLDVPEAVVLTEGQRILFVIPWGERIILGTTDTDYEGDPAAVSTDRADVDYILDIVNDAFPAAAINPSDIISTWAGVRPLVASGSEKQGSPSDISRSHIIRQPQPGWFDVAGGKLTTYRHMAQQAVTQVQLAKGIRWRWTGPPTAKEPLNAGPFSGVLPPPVKQEVVEECCRHEWAVHLADVMLRRTSWHFYHANQDEIARQVAQWMAQTLNWNPAKTAAELELYRQSVRRFQFRPV